MTTNENMPGAEPGDLLDTLRITKTTRRLSAGGTWVTGTIAGHRFQALAFPEPAEHREWEVGGDSRISKLWIADADGRQVYNWDRGADMEPATVVAGQIVDLLAAGLAEHIFGS